MWFASYEFMCSCMYHIKLKAITFEYIKYNSMHIVFKTWYMQQLEFGSSMDLSHPYNQAIILIFYVEKEIYLYKHALYKEN